MLKKHKRILIAVCVSVLLLTLLLLLLSLCRLYVGEYGLNYNAITASFSDSNVYEPGLYLIGIANSFLRVKSQEIIHLSNLTGYSSDFFQLNADFEITYSVDLSQTNANFTNFTVLS